MVESYPSLRRLFADAGYTFIEPPLLHDARVFVELAGEDLRRQLYLTSNGDGTELALRPDYTIPVCVQHIAGGPARRRADYAYLGPVFRQRQNESGEFLQAGVESIGRSDRAATDADILKLALAAVDELRVRKPIVWIGDSGLFAAVLDSLDLVQPWRRRLARAFGDPARLNALLDRLAAGTDAPSLPQGLNNATGQALRSSVEEMLMRSGLANVGARLAEEIAARFVEKDALARGDKRAAKVLRKFLAIAGEPRKAVSALRKLTRTEKLDIGGAIDFFERRNARFADHGIGLRSLSFAADFGRRLDYYTGFVFEIYAGAGGRPIAGGGRYDRLLGLMAQAGAKKAAPVPAVGFALSLDRIRSRR